MEHVLLVIHVIIAAALIGMVLLQRSDQDGFGLGGGGGSGLLSGRTKANVLTRTTAILAALFIANSLLLSVLASNHRAPSIVDSIEKEQTKAAFEKTAPAVPNAGEDKTVGEEKAKADTDSKVAEKVKVEKGEAPAPATAEGKEAQKEVAPVVTEQKIAPKPKAKKAKPAASDDEEPENSEQ